MNGRLYCGLRIAGKCLTGIFALWYTAQLVWLLLTTPMNALKLILASLILFLTVTLMRRLFKSARPYQENAGDPPRKGTYDSFPSRHAYSAFYIATLAFTFAPAASYALLPLAILLAAIRVLTGIHYPRDVIAGAFLGVAFATVTIIIL